MKFLCSHLCREGDGTDERRGGGAALRRVSRDRCDPSERPSRLQPLLPPASATTLRVRNGQVSTTDGPFAETREVFGGYYVI